MLDSLDRASASTTADPRPRPATLKTPMDLKPNAIQELSGALNYSACGHVRVVGENEEFPLARFRPALSGLPPPLGRTGRSNLCDYRRNRWSARKLGGTAIRSIGHIAARSRQRYRLRHARGHARGAARR